MKIAVEHISIPAMSTVGIGYGTTEDGRKVTFVGDQRPMRDLGRALAESREPLTAEIEEYQLLSVDLGPITYRRARPTY